ncbi:tryptophan dimethylallyltransferase-domain-containing protein, partial [Mycena olivaceomarginata]
MPTPTHLAALLLSWVIRTRVLLSKYSAKQHNYAVDDSSNILAEGARSLSYLLARASYPDELRQEYLAFFNDKLAPLFGPSPAEFSGSTPSSFISDGPYSIRVHLGNRKKRKYVCAKIDAIPRYTSRNAISDLTWSNICRRTLLFDPPCPNENRVHFQHSSQFFLGGDFETHANTIVGKVYFLPHVRAALEGVSDFSLVNNCISDLGVEDCWGPASSYFDSIPESNRPTIAMVAVDCLEPAKNRAKVYIRTQNSSFNDIVELLTLGGRISDEYVAQTVSTMRHLWRLFFPGVADDTPLSSKRGPEYYPTGFLIYYEMSLGRAVLVPKVYIPVRHYCDSDSQIATALSRYFKDVGLDEVGERYHADLKQM